MFLFTRFLTILNLFVPHVEDRVNDFLHISMLLTQIILLFIL